MKTRSYCLFIALLFLIPHDTQAQGTAFTYQGRLTDNGAAANGTYDLQFTLHDTNAGGSVVAGPTNSAINVNNGLFTVSLDFGAASFDGSPRWLQIGVRTNGGGTFISVSPRQRLAPSPYAILAANVPTNSIASSNLQNGAVTSAKIAGGAVGPTQIASQAVGPTHVLVGSISTSQLADNSVTAAKIALSTTWPGFLALNSVGPGQIANSAVSTSQIRDNSVTAVDVVSNTFWQTAGNSDTTPGAHFLGTTDNQPLEFKVNNQRALRLEPNATSANILGGFIGNFIQNGVVGAVIAGGGSPAAINTVGGNYCTVAGGQGNTSAGDCATAIGFRSVANGIAATALGRDVVANGTAATAIGDASVAIDNSLAAGTRAKAFHSGCFVWADTQFSDFTSSGPNQFMVRAAGGVGINTATPPGAMLQVGDTSTPNSQGMIRLASRSGAGPASRYWDIGVPEGDEETAGKFYSFVIDDPQLGTEPELVVRWGTGNVGIGTSNPSSRLHAVATTANGVEGTSDSANGVQGTSIAANGVQGTSSSGAASGVYGENFSGNGYGVAGRATGGGKAVFGDNPSGSGYAGYFNGNVYVAGTLTPPSDRNVKRDFAPVNVRDVLEKVANMSVQSWSYTNNPSVRHLGPVAQDFRAAFGLGADDKSIATVDADGVALAAIQGLNQKLEEQLNKKEARITALEQSVAELKEIVAKFAEKR